MILLVGTGADAVNTGRVRECFVLGDQSRSGILPGHKPRTQPRVRHQKAGQFIVVLVRVVQPHQS